MVRSRAVARIAEDNRRPLPQHILYSGGASQNALRRTGLGSSGPVFRVASTCAAGAAPTELGSEVPPDGDRRRSPARFRHGHESTHDSRHDERPRASLGINGAREKKGERAREDARRPHALARAAASLLAAAAGYRCANPSVSALLHHMARYLVASPGLASAATSS